MTHNLVLRAQIVMEKHQSAPWCENCNVQWPCKDYANARDTQFCVVNPPDYLVAVVALHKPTVHCTVCRVSWPCVTWQAAKDTYSDFGLTPL